MATSTVDFQHHPKTQLFLHHFRLIMDLTAEKVARHMENPAQYPLPAQQQSLEVALHNVLMAVNKTRQRKFLDGQKAAFAATAAQRKQKFGDLAGLDLKKNIAVAEQAKAFPLPEAFRFTETESRPLLRKVKHTVKKATAAKPVPRQAVATILDFFVDSLTCEKTNDIRKDEISIRGLGTDGNGVTSETGATNVGAFKKGETISLGAKSLLFSFPLDDGSVGANFPLTFLAGVIVTESDLINNADLGRKLTILFSVLFIVLMVVSVALLFIPAVPFAVAFAGAIGASVSGILGHYVFPVLVDDFSDPVLDTLVLETPPAIGETFTRTLDVPIGVSLLGFDKGRYKANVRWVVR